MLVQRLIKSIWTFAFTKDEETLEEMTAEEYINIFIKGRTKEAIEATYKKAWEAKNFEIEHYWKRATYFWAFQVASFAGYFSVLNTKANHQFLYIVACIGFITALAWTLINQGSKTWQRNWEIHVDMLENEITGPLYKVITASKTFSVSKINEIVSRFIVSIWVIVIIKYFKDNVSFRFDNQKEADIIVWLCTIALIYFTLSMITGYGRGRFGNTEVKFYKRKFRI